MRITEEYRKEQEKLHENPEYGVASSHYAPMVAGLINKTGVEKILDYGAGKGRLGQSLVQQPLTHKVLIDHYEPAVEDWADDPEPSDLVCCIDVLEHIEPECLDNVLDHLQELTKYIGFFTVHTGPAKKTLSDGRNAHLTQEGPEWWLPKIMDRFQLVNFTGGPNGFYVIVGVKPNGS